MEKNGNSNGKILKWDSRISLGQVFVIITVICSFFWAYAAYSFQVEENTRAVSGIDSKFVTRSEFSLLMKRIDDIQSDIKELRQEVRQLGSQR